MLGLQDSRSFLWLARRSCLLTSVVALAVTVVSCGGLSLHTDGPLTAYLKQPIPKLQRPIARTLSLEIVAYNTASSDKASMVSDHVGRDLYILPGDVGEEVAQLLQMDAAFSEQATLAALNLIAAHRNEARHASSLRRAKDAPTTLGTSETAPADGGWSVETEPESSPDLNALQNRAVEASAGGNHVAANVLSAAASVRASGSQGLSNAIARSQATTAGLQASHSAGVALIEGEFAAVRHWIEVESGAVGPGAPERTHLSVFLLEYFDASWGRLDSRMRAAVLVMLVDADGGIVTVLEGSDVLTCAGECNVFVPKPTSAPFPGKEVSDDVRTEVFSPDGMKARNADGFDNVGGIYQYILLRHALAKLERRATHAAGRGR